MNMSIIEIALYIALHIYGSVVPQLSYKHMTGRYSLPCNWKFVAAFNAAFCALYLWIMSVSTWGYYILWTLTILGTVLITIGCGIAIKPRTQEV